MLVQAATDPRLTVTMNDLDAHPWELNTPAGIVDLRTGELCPSDPAKLHTRVTGCAPDLDADPTTWTRFLPTPSAATPTSSPTCAASSATPPSASSAPTSSPSATAPAATARASSSKSSSRSSATTPPPPPPGSSWHPPTSPTKTEIARLAGARMVLCSEVNEDDRFDEAKVKQLTGGDTLTARFMRQDHFTFAATHQLWLMGNHKPAVRSGGRSFWRRLRLVPFEHEVPEDKVVDDLQGILSRDHGPAILAWIIQGAVQYAEGGLREPESVKAATADYAHDQDTVGRFVEECCRVGGGEHVQIKVGIVRAAYERWCLSEGEQPVTAKAFGQALARRFGVDSARTKRSRMYVGLALNGDEDASPGDEPDDDPSPPDGNFWTRGMAS
jgi:putative DNA primase/helicase